MSFRHADATLFGSIEEDESTDTDTVLCSNLTFGEAIEVLKDGKKVARTGWNGKGMFLYLTGGSIVPYNNLTGNAGRYVTKEVTGTDDACICSHIDMKAADGTIVVGWLASQTDMLAEDWEVVE